MVVKTMTLGVVLSSPLTCGGLRLNRIHGIWTTSWLLKPCRTKAEHECTRELPRFILMSILHAILLTWILTGSTIWVTRIHESSTCAMRVTHHGSDSLKYLRVPIGTHEYLQTTITNGLYISFSIQNLVYINGNFGLRYFFTFPPFRPLALVLESYNDFVTRDCWWEITP